MEASSRPPRRSRNSIDWKRNRSIPAILDPFGVIVLFTQQERAIPPKQPRHGLRANRSSVSSSSKTSSSPASQASQVSRAILPRPQRQVLRANRSLAPSFPASRTILPRLQRQGFRLNRALASSSSETSASSSQPSQGLSLRS